MTVFLPQVTIQHDFQTVIAEIQEGVIQEEPFWVSCYKHDHESVHGKVKVQRTSNGDVELFSDLNGLQFQRDEHRKYSVTCPELSVQSTNLRVPRQVIRNSTQSRAVTAFDVAPDSSLYAMGDDDGNISVHSPSDHSGVNLSAKPHLSSILSLRFFPSSKVILSGSNDFTLCVISAENLSVPRVLKAHSRAVTDSAIIARGKNVLSCAKDGTLRLWDVASGAQIRLMGSKNYSPMYKMSLGDKVGEFTAYKPPDGELSSEAAEVSLDPREVETTEKIVFTAHQNGSFEAFDLGSKVSLFSSGPPSKRSPLESIAYSATDRLLATGSRSGIITVYDTRELSSPLLSFQRNGASVEEIAFVSNQSDVRLAIATTDGLPYVASVRPEGPQVVEELVGYNCDPVRGIRAIGGSLWTAGDDGTIRRY